MPKTLKKTLEVAIDGKAYYRGVRNDSGWKYSLLRGTYRYEDPGEIELEFFGNKIKVNIDSLKDLVATVEKNI